jgi:tetratricopeptide (TPR) repeat protein
MPDSREHQVERLIEGSLTPIQARELAQAALDNPELFEELTYQAVAKSALVQGAADPLHTFFSGKLSASRERQLAQAALDNEELFDALVAHGAVEKSLQDPAFREALARPAESRAKVLRFPNKARAVAIGSIAAALAVIGIYSWKSLSSGRNPALSTTAKIQAAPGLEFSSNRPILLAAGLRPESAKNGAAPLFRSAEIESRAPQPTGTILSVNQGQATISLGSLDGLTKGAELRLFRGDQSKQPTARLVVTTVFRDRARATVAGGETVRASDRVESPIPVYLGAILEEMNRLAEQGDPAKARSLARDALARAKVPSGAARRIFERLGELDYQAGDVARAEEDYQSAVASFAGSPSPTSAEQATILNALGALYLLRGEYGQAEAPLNEARDKVADGVEYARTLNNLGVLAELRGDGPKAVALYRDALRALANAPDAQDRKAVDANLARLGSVADGKH